MIEVILAVMLLHGDAQPPQRPPERPEIAGSRVVPVGVASRGGQGRGIGETCAQARERMRWSTMPCRRPEGSSPTPPSR